MELWIPTMTVLGIYALAVISPGPNFLVISQNALAYSRGIGLRTALGVASGSILWIAFGFLGVAAVFAQISVLFMAVKFLGAGYLLYAAFKMVRRKPREAGPTHLAKEAGNSSAARNEAFKHGLMTQMSNPKAALFTLALFSSVLAPETPGGIKVGMAVAMVSFSFSWYVLVAAIFSQSGFQRVYGRFERSVNLAFAGLLVWLTAHIIFGG